MSSFFITTPPASLVSVLGGSFLGVSSSKKSSIGDVSNSAASNPSSRSADQPVVVGREAADRPYDSDRMSVIGYVYSMSRQIRRQALLGKSEMAYRKAMFAKEQIKSLRLAALMARMTGDIRRAKAIAAQIRAVVNDLKAAVKDLGSSGGMAGIAESANNSDMDISRTADPTREDTSEINTRTEEPSDPALGDGERASAQGEDLAAQTQPPLDKGGKLTESEEDKSAKGSDDTAKGNSPESGASKLDFDALIKEAQEVIDGAKNVLQILSQVRKKKTSESADQEIRKATESIGKLEEELNKLGHFGETASENISNELINTSEYGLSAANLWPSIPIFSEPTVDIKI